MYTFMKLNDGYLSTGRARRQWPARRHDDVGNVDEDRRRRRSMPPLPVPRFNRPIGLI